jgi:hypothetical protein
VVERKHKLGSEKLGAIKLGWCTVFVVFFAVIIVLGSGGGCNGNNPGGCQENIDCEAAEYCGKEVDNCSGEGECLPMPEICPDLWDPVCGCDGNTYGNACEAEAVGINVASEGECPPPPCTDNDDCLTGEYCGKDLSDCGGIGECLTRPLGCPDVWNPVCGCDGNTYGNECEAQAAGVNVAQNGECPQPSCTDNSDCEVTEYCDKTVDDCDGVGECLTRPLGCPDVWDPVCGCDGITYGNDCEAQAAGINVDITGVCPQPPCSDNIECTVNEYCEKAVGDCDGTGECLPMPVTCIDIWDPVCGCDGKTYGNACEAAVVSINIASEGECP